MTPEALLKVLCVRLASPFTDARTARKRPWLKWTVGGSLALFTFWLACVHYTDYAHLGIMRNDFTGAIWADTPGWNFSAPWIRVAKVDTRPQRVCVTSAGRGYSCKLVQFVPAQYASFVKTEGFRYWWWSNRFSYNSGYDDEYRGVRDLLRGYGYSPTKHPFIRVVKEYVP